MGLNTTIKGITYDFDSLKDVLSRANEEKSGDLLAGIGAQSDIERAAAKEIISEVTLMRLREEPVVPYDDDEITRIIDDGIDEEVFDKIKSWTVADLREHLLSHDRHSHSPDRFDVPIEDLRRALTGEMAAAVTKIMSNMDLVRAAARLRVVSRANTTLGKEGTLGARLQPNHPSDSIEGILASTYEGGSYMYFETGQGSELSSRTHNQADQLTLEARCYALARHFDPFLVNDVVGFIGPEYLKDGKQMIRAGLEDHFMGKLLGVPMGIDACYTNHMDADQNDLENLSMLLILAGVNYFMGVPMGDDVMLSYQTTSFHDIASLRELNGLRPAEEFEQWLEERGLMLNGKLTEKAGDGRIIRGMRRTRV